MSPLRPREDPRLMHIAITTTGTHLWVQVSGEVDLSHHDRLRAALATADVREADILYLDVRQLARCDRRGTEILLQFEREARLSGHPTRIWGASPNLRKVLDCIAHQDSLTFI